MIDDVLSDYSDQDQLVLLLWVYLQELACPYPYSVSYKLTPAIALRKVSRDCALNPTRAACMRRRRIRRAHASRWKPAATAPHQQFLNFCPAYRDGRLPSFQLRRRRSVGGQP